MKKLILTLLAGGLAAGSAFAHGGNDCFNAGNILLYGVGSYTNSHGSDNTSFASASGTTIDRPRMLNWTVSPGIGFNVADNLTIGVDFNYNGSKTTYDRKDVSFGSNGYGTDMTRTFNYGVGPFVRYSMPIGEHFFWYGQLEAHYLRGRFTTRSTNATGSNSFVKDDNYKGVDAMYTPAVGVMVCKSVALTFGIGGIGYEYRKYDFSTQGQPAGFEHTAKTNDFNVSFGQQVNIGVQKYFGCGHKMHGHHEPMDDTHSMDAPEGDSKEDNGDGGRRRKRKNDDE